jgi:hypothetical protein
LSRIEQEEPMNLEQTEELILQSLEHEKGGVLVYTKALECVQNEDLKSEWEHYLEQTRVHVKALEEVCSTFGIEPDRETPGMLVVRHTGASLVRAMEMALSSSNLAAAELVACECVVLAETKDHSNWELLGKVGDHLTGDRGIALRAAYQAIEDQEDEHLYHTKGWCRELWLGALGLTAILPPPEERQKVKTAIGAARAEQSAELMR